jgi:lipopolysaccharide biosynthesis regulator YciM
MMLDWPLYLGLVSALAIGFLLGRSKLGGTGSSDSFELDQNYFTGVNYLLSEQSDKAIDAFVQSLEVNADTLETHLALGNLLRKRGEVERAVRIHQNLLSRPGLNAEQLQQVQYELSIDYVKSGLFDRSEELLVLLVKQDGPYKIDALKQLLEIYQDEKEWLLGLDVLERLSGRRFSRAYEEWVPTRAHFFCELAEGCLGENDFEGARKYLNQALAADDESVRSLILLGRVDIYTGDVGKGVLRLQQVASSYEDYTTEVLPYILSAYKKQNNQGESLKYLLCLNEDTHNPDVLIAAAELMAAESGELAAAEFVAAEVVRFPTGLGLRRLLEYYLSFSQGATYKYLSSLSEVMDKVVVGRPSYQCCCCGFKARGLLWLCPRCKKWGSLKFKHAVADE